MLKKYVPKSQTFSELFNKNTVKLGYSSKRNVAAIVIFLNQNVLKPCIELQLHSNTKYNV